MLLSRVGAGSREQQPHASLDSSGSAAAPLPQLPVYPRYPAECGDLDRMEFFLSLLCLRTLPTMFFLIRISFRNLLPEGFPSPSRF